MYITVLIQWNRFVKNDQVAPEGWNTNWNGDAHIVYLLTEEDFFHGDTAVPVTGIVGGSGGEETISFAISFPYSETDTYSLYVAAYADNKVTVMNQDLTVICEAVKPNYEKTISGIEGGQYVIIEMYGEASANSNEYLISL